MGTLIYFIFTIFAPCDTDLEPYYLLWRRLDKNSNVRISTSESQLRRRQERLCP